MAKTNAERQAALRQRKRNLFKKDEGVCARLDVWVNTSVRMDLEMLSMMEKSTIAETLERVITEAREAAEKAHGRDAWENLRNVWVERGIAKGPVNSKRREAINKNKEAALIARIELEQLKKHVTG